MSKKAGFWWLLLAFSFVIMSGGCGGGGGNGGDPEAPNEPAPPLRFIEEDWEYIQNNVIDMDIENLVRTDGTYIIPRSGSSSVQAFGASSTTVSGQQAKLDNMMERAVRLTKPFGASDIRGNTRPHDGGGSVPFGQKRFVYVYPAWGPDYAKDNVAIKQYLGSDSKCQHGMFGMDCVAFMVMCAEAAGINLTVPWDAGGRAARRLWEGEAFWQGLGFTEAKDVTDEETGKVPPKPGDILAWWKTRTVTNSDGKDEIQYFDTHIGIVVEYDTGRIGLAHSIANGGDAGEYQFTCQRYREDIEGNKINGPVISRFNAKSGLTSETSPRTNTEFRRIRLISETTPVTNDNWIDAADTSWYNTNQDSFMIYNAYQLAGVAKLVNDATTSFSGKTITLADNISLAGAEWTPIGREQGLQSRSFLGTFDGNGRTISNMKISEEWRLPVGLFAVVGVVGIGYEASAVVRNVNMTNVNISSYDTRGTTGGIVGLNYGTVSDCTVSGSIVAHGGGIVGGNVGRVSNCYSSANITPPRGGDAGGIAGDNMGTVTHSISSGNISSSSYIVTDDYGNVNSAFPAHAGGIVGTNTGTISNCESRGNVSATNPSLHTAGSGGVTAGGIVGRSNGTVTDSHKLSGTVSVFSNYDDTFNSERARAGGVIGRSSTSVAASVSGNTFSVAATGQTYGIGEDWRNGSPPYPPSNNGAEPR